MGSPGRPEACAWGLRGDCLWSWEGFEDEVGAANRWALFLRRLLTEHEGAAQFAQGDLLNLADPLAGDSQDGTDLFQGLTIATADAEARD